MEPKTTSTEEKILEQLILLNERTAKRNSIKSTFITGLITGIGFFVGSAILATIALGVLTPWAGEIEWVRENFERGSSLK